MPVESERKKERERERESHANVRYETALSYYCMGNSVKSYRSLHLRAARC